MYLRSSLSNSFERVEVEAFSKGSIIVDYYVVFKELLETITTQDLKDTVEIETRQYNNDHMLGALKIDPKHSDFIGKAKKSILVLETFDFLPSYQLMQQSKRQYLKMKKRSCHPGRSLLLSLDLHRLPL